MSEVKVQDHILYPVSNQCTSFSFHINPTNHSWDMAKIMLTLKKHIRNFYRKFAKITVFNRITPKSNQVITMNRATKLPRFVVGQGHGKVIQYISPDPYILCAKYQRFSSIGFHVRGKSFCGGGRGRGRGRGRQHDEPLASLATSSITICCYISCFVFVMFVRLCWK